MGWFNKKTDEEVERELQEVRAQNASVNARYHQQRRSQDMRQRLAEEKRELRQKQFALTPVGRVVDTTKRAIASPKLKAIGKTVSKLSESSGRKAAAIDNFMWGSKQQPKKVKKEHDPFGYF